MPNLVCTFAVAALAILGIIAVVNAIIERPHDDSDPPGGRSGVAVVTDHATGLQYLRSPGGGITPRLGVDGRQMRVAEGRP